MKKKFSFKKVLSLLAVLVIVFSMCVPVSAGTASDAKNSVVAVGGINGGQGSGFAIGEVGKPVEYIVTNNHVVNGIKGNENNTTALVAFDIASGEIVTANIYFSDIEKDVAILKLPQPTDKREPLVLCPIKYVDLDDAFAALGYPGNQYTDWPQYNTNDITVTKGGIKKQDRVGGRDVYMLDLTITHGNSGGPLVNSKGEVVGINTFGLLDDNYAIAIDELLDIINTDKIRVSVHGEVNWLLIAGIAVLLVIIVLVIILITRKKGDNTQIDNGGVGGAGVTTPMTPPAQPEKATARVIAIGGTLNGRRYNVTGAVKMGRDSSKCGIAFPVNTQGVSAVHCEVAFDGAVCYVKDLNSSYGTFAVDGRKLAPNAPMVLRSGDKFYLASPENTFEVRF